MKQTKTDFLFRVLFFSALVAAALAPGSTGAYASPAPGRDWPQAGGNPQHTNFSPDSPAPPYRMLWRASFSPEILFSAQPVIAGGRVFQTTLNGNLYALDAASGSRLWHFRAGTSVWGSAAAGTAECGPDGLVFVAGWDGIVFGLDAATGREIWRYDAGETISGSVCLAQDTVFIGTRRGTALALDAATGSPRWTQRLSWHIYSTLGWDSGRLFAITEDMYVHCLDAADGRRLWTSAKLHGMLMREFYPVLHRGRVLLNLTPSGWSEHREYPCVEPFVGWTWEEDPERKKRLEAFFNSNTRPYPGPADKALSYARGPVSLMRGRTMPLELDAAQARIGELYALNPEFQSFYVLDAETGAQPYTPVQIYSGGGLENLVMPPAVCADGTVVTHTYMNGSTLARFDVEKNRWVDIMVEFCGTANDNAEYVSVGGTRVFSKNFMRGGHGQGAGYILDYETREFHGLAEEGKSAAPAMRVSAMPDEWNPAERFSPQRIYNVGAAPAPISGSRFYWIKAESELIAIEGNLSEE